MSYPIGDFLSSWQERVTQSPKYIDTDHAYIHAGGAFENSITVAEVATTGRIVFDTPATKYVHFRPSQVFLSKGSVSYTLFEDTSSTGTGAVPWTLSTGTYNRNRTSTQAATAVVYSVSTSTGGVAIDRWTLWGSGTTAGAGRQGAAYSEPLEWVLQRGTEYRIELDTTEALTLNLFWYEEDAG